MPAYYKYSNLINFQERYTNLASSDLSNVISLPKVGITLKYYQPV